MSKKISKKQLEYNKRIDKGKSILHKKIIDKKIEEFNTNINKIAEEAEIDCYNEEDIFDCENGIYEETDRLKKKFKDKLVNKYLFTIF